VVAAGTGGQCMACQSLQTKMLTGTLTWTHPRHSSSSSRRMTQQQQVAVLVQPAVLQVAAPHLAVVLLSQQGLPWRRAGRVGSARRAGSSRSRG
jgi:hypothetical protein